MITGTAAEIKEKRREERVRKGEVNEKEGKNTE